ncbi:hypothetical protein [Salana multivorans]
MQLLQRSDEVDAAVVRLRGGRPVSREACQELSQLSYACEHLVDATHAPYLIHTDHDAIDL